FTTSIWVDPINRRSNSSFENTPTTLVHRFSSLLTLSIRFVVQTRFHCLYETAPAIFMRYYACGLTGIIWFLAIWWSCRIRPLSDRRRVCSGVLDILDLQALLTLPALLFQPGTNPVFL